MIVLDIAQRSPEWFQARLGKLTGSRAADMLATIKNGEAAARRDYRLQLACERLTGQSQENGYVNAEMQRGIDMEPAALSAYEAATGELVEPVGFVAHDTLMAGCSPDGQIGKFAGILEIKVPKSATHLKYLRSQKVPTEYFSQITHNLWITGAQWCDFASFDDRFPEPLRLLCLRVDRADVDLVAYEKAALAFLDEVSRECEAVATMAEVGF